MAINAISASLSAKLRSRAAQYSDKYCDHSQSRVSLPRFLHGLSLILFPELKPSYRYRIKSRQDTQSPCFIYTVMGDNTQDYFASDSWQGARVCLVNKAAGSALDLYGSKSGLPTSVSCLCFQTVKPRMEQRCILGNMTGIIPTRSSSSRRFILTVLGPRGRSPSRATEVRLAGLIPHTTSEKQ